MKYYLSLGSNKGDREDYLARARRELGKKGVKILKASSICESEPVDYKDQPWFLNQVLEVETQQSPLSLLKSVKAIELKLGRRHLIPKGPRRIDIDILLNEDRVLQSPDLTIPHPSLHKRKFILAGLIEIAPEIKHPVLKNTVKQIWLRLEDVSEVNVFSTRLESKSTNIR